MARVTSRKPAGRTPAKAAVTKVPRHRCPVCGSSKPHTEYPLQIRGTARHVVTCTDCLKSAGILENDDDRMPELDAHPTRQYQGNGGDDRARRGNVIALQPAVDADPVPDDAAGETDMPDAREEGGVEAEEPHTQPKRRTKRRRATKNYFTPRKRVRKPTQPPPTEFTCRICVEEKPIDDFIPWQSTHIFRMDLLHAPPFCIPHLSRPQNARPYKEPICKECISRTFVAALETVGAERIVCPDESCQLRWDPRYVLRFLPRTLHEAYNEDLFALFWSRAYKVTCPTEGCGVAAYVDHQRTPGFPHVECHKCETRICALCLVPWHTNLTCQQYRQKNYTEVMESEEMKTLRALAKQGAKRCPRCQMAIEKDGGCDSMYCQHCEKYFDWARAEPVLGVRAKNTYDPTAADPSDYYRETCELDAIAAKAQAAANPPEQQQQQQQQQQVFHAHPATNAVVDHAMAAFPIFPSPPPPPILGRIIDDAFRALPPPPPPGRRPGS